MIRMFFAGTSIKPRTWNHLKDAIPISENHKNMIYRKNGNNISYYFPGPLGKVPLDQGTYSIEKSFKRGVKILSDEIRDSLRKEPNKEILVEIGGHSRGAVAAGRVAKKIQTDFKSYDNVKVGLVSLDPVPGPGHYNDDVDLELPKNDRSVVVYSVTTPSRLYSPQMVRNPEVAIIVPRGHESVYGIKGPTALCDTQEKFYYIYNGKSYTLSELAQLEKGIYMCFEGCTLTKLNLDNLEKCIDIIYDRATESKRIRTLMDTIIQKLDLNLDQMLNVNGTYRSDFQDVLVRIDKSWTLSSAFNYALDMFKNKSQFSYMINKDKTYESILEAKQAVCSFKVDPIKAWEKLKTARENENVSKYGKYLLNSLINRIERKYDLNK